MIRLQTVFFAMIITFGMKFIHAQSAVSCSCTTDPYCLIIRNALDQLAQAVSQIMIAIAEAQRVAQQYPQYPELYVNAQNAITILREAATFARDIILERIQFCKDDTCCNQCCESSFGQLNIIYNETAMTVPNITFIRARPMLCQSVASVQNATTT